MQTLEIKKGLLACIWVCAATVSVAQTVTVGFAGRVVSPTCAWAISGAGVSGQAGAMAVPLVPTPVPASPSNLADNTFGKTVFSMGTTGCSHSYSVAPIVSISMRQTNGSYIQSGEKNFALEVGMESASNKRIKTRGFLSKAYVLFSCLLIPSAIKQKKSDQTARCETISIGLAGCNNGQYKGNAPHNVYADTPKSKPVLYLDN